MGASETDLTTLPDLEAGVPADAIPMGDMLVGRVGEQAVLVARTEDGLQAVQATCPHYGAPLIDGCIHEGRIHCPWHHAAFDLTDGGLNRPPALDPLQSWRVEEVDGVVRVPDATPQAPRAGMPLRRRGQIAVVGAGAAGAAAVLTLRQAGHDGPIALIDPEPTAPYDRPNLSKDYLAGTAPEEWLPLRPPEAWSELDVHRIEDRVAAIDPSGHTLELDGGHSLDFDGLILATGASPRRLPVPGADADHVRVLRSLDDCRRIRERAEAGTRALIVGAGFIGLEVAASLRSLEVEVDIVAPEPVLLAGVLGEELGTELRALHERHGVRFHLGTSVRRIETDAVELEDGSSVDAELVIVGIGVEPRLDLARQTGLNIDDGVVVDSFLESSQEGIFVAGDLASFPHPVSGRSIRIEHWAVAQAQGRTAALNLLGHGRPYRDVPFFWTTQYGVTLQWAGYPDPWDSVERDGTLEGESLAARFNRDGEPVAAAFVGRDQDGLQWEFDLADRIAAARG